MAKVALYQGGNRKAGFYALTLEKSVKRAHRTHISQAAFDAFGRKDLEVFEEGVRLGDQTVVSPKIPLIFIRTEGNKCDRTHRVFIAKSDRNEIGRHFGLPLDILKERAFFIMRSGQSLSRKTILIKLSRSELLEPEWRYEMLDWAAGFGSLPFPSKLMWEPFADGRISLPALLPVLDCAGAKKGMRRKLVLDEVQGMRQAYYHLRKGKVLGFSIDFDEVSYLKPSPIRDHVKIFQSEKFKKLFGAKPKLATYSCSKISGKIGISFGNIRGEVFTVRSPALQADELYHFNFFRKGNLLLIECYLDAERTSLLGKRTVSLSSGYPLKDVVTLVISKK